MSRSTHTAPSGMLCGTRHRAGYTSFDVPDSAPISNGAPPVVPPRLPAATTSPISGVRALGIVAAVFVIGLQIWIVMVTAWVLLHNPHMRAGSLGLLTVSDTLARLLMISTLGAMCIGLARRSRWTLALLLSWAGIHLIWVPAGFFAFASHSEPPPEGVAAVLLVLFFRVPASVVPFAAMIYWLIPLVPLMVWAWIRTVGGSEQRA